MNAEPDGGAPLSDILSRLRERWGEVHLDGYPSGAWICSDRDAYCRTHMPCIRGEGRTAEEAADNALNQALGARRGAGVDDVG